MRTSGPCRPSGRRSGVDASAGSGPGWPAARAAPRRPRARPGRRLARRRPAPARARTSRRRRWRSPSRGRRTGPWPPRTSGSAAARRCLLASADRRLQRGRRSSPRRPWSAPRRSSSTRGQAEQVGRRPCAAAPGGAAPAARPRPPSRPVVPAGDRGRPRPPARRPAAAASWASSAEHGHRVRGAQQQPGGVPAGGQQPGHPLRPPPVSSRSSRRYQGESPERVADLAERQQPGVGLRPRRRTSRASPAAASAGSRPGGTPRR